MRFYSEVGALGGMDYSNRDLASPGRRRPSVTLPLSDGNTCRPGNCCRDDTEKVNNGEFSMRFFHDESQCSS